MKLLVPYCSQYSASDPAWRPRVCAIASLKMVMDFLAQKSGDDHRVPTLDSLIAEGETIGAHGVNGWVHAGLCSLARNHGFQCYNQEFKSRIIDLATKGAVPGVYETELVDDGIGKIVATLKGGAPVIVSIAKYFTEHGRYHMVVLTGYEEEEGRAAGFSYHDPESPEEKGGPDLFIDLATFKNGWRKFALFVYSL